MAERQQEALRAVAGIKMWARANKELLLAQEIEVEVVVAKIILRGGTYVLPDEGVIVEDEEGERWFVPTLITTSGRSRWAEPGDRVRLSPYKNADCILAFLL
jgi:hypothetical protein